MQKLWLDRAVQVFSLLLSLRCSQNQNALCAFPHSLNSTFIFVESLWHCYSQGLFVPSPLIVSEFGLRGSDFTHIIHRYVFPKHVGCKCQDAGRHSAAT